ncbi:MAG: hypothetical protein J3Q66DRAFT_323498, partial [Benniella sp.]
MVLLLHMVMLLLMLVLHLRLHLELLLLRARRRLGHRMRYNHGRTDYLLSLLRLELLLQLLLLNVLKLLLWLLRLNISMRSTRWRGLLILGLQIPCSRGYSRLIIRHRL